MPAGAPGRGEAGAPSVEVFDGEQDEPLAQLTYDFHSRELFRGSLRGRTVEILRTSQDTALDRGLLKHFLFPFPCFLFFTSGLQGSSLLLPRYEGLFELLL